MLQVRTLFEMILAVMSYRAIFNVLTDTRSVPVD